MTDYEKVLQEAELILDNSSASTKRNYITALREFSDFPTRSVIVAKTAKWKKAGLNANSIALRYCAIRWLMKHFSRCFDTYDREDSLNYMKENKVMPAKVAVATPEQVEKLIANAPSRTALAIGLMFYNGLRVSDTVGLTLSNFTTTDEGTVLSFRDQKTKKLHEYILLPQTEKLYLNYVKGERKDTIARWKSDQVDDGSLFLSARGSLSQNGLQRDVSELCKRVGFPNLHCHSFRHGCGTAYAKAGAGVEIIQNVLGHKNIASSARYIHLSKEDVYKASQNVF